MIVWIIIGIPVGVAVYEAWKVVASRKHMSTCEEYWWCNSILHSGRYPKTPTP